MSAETSPLRLEGVPSQNISQGLLDIEIPGLDNMYRGKVRNNWIVDDERIIATTDRLSAFDRYPICTVPGKGMALNLLSAEWFRRTERILTNHLKAVIHPNVTVAEQIDETLPVEVIVRDYMARSMSGTSVYRHYSEGERNIYGRDFPDGLEANEVFPMGPIVTPTTKAAHGEHDEMLTNEEAAGIVDRRFGSGMWDFASDKSVNIFCRGAGIYASTGIILADTKYEMGVNNSGELTLIDELFTPDSSRLWLEQSYKDRFMNGEDPENFDKELVRRNLSDRGFTGDGTILPVSKAVISSVAEAYSRPFEMLTKRTLPKIYIAPNGKEWDVADPEGIHVAVDYWLNDREVGRWE